MLYEAKSFALKDGRQAVLRNPDPERDAAEMISCLKQVCGETEFLLRYPEECPWTVEQEKQTLADINGYEGRLMLVCEVGGEIAGMCGLNLYPQLKYRHRADVDIALLQRFWGLGIGTAMFESMIAVARGKGLLQLELDYIDGNARGKALYEKMGFEQVGERPDAVRLRDGSLRSLMLMTKKL